MILDERNFLEWTKNYRSSAYEQETVKFFMPWIEICYCRFFEIFREFDMVRRVFFEEKDLVLLDAGFFPGTLFKGIKRLNEESCSWKFHGIGLISPQDFDQEMKDEGISSHRVNLDPAVITPQIAGIKTTIPLESESVDIAFSTEVIEHLIQPSHMLSEIKRVLKKGGVLILTTPNLTTLGNRLRLLTGKTIFQDIEEDELKNLTDWRPHFREYTMDELCDMLEREDFVVIWKKYQNLKWSSRMLLTLPPLKRFFRYLYNFVPMLYPPFSQGIIITSRKPGAE